MGPALALLLLFRSPALEPLLDRHLDTAVKIASSSGRVYSLSAQAWEARPGGRGETGAFLVFHRSGAAPYAERIGSNLFCVLCSDGGTLVEPEPGERFRVRISPHPSDEAGSVLTIKAEGAGAAYSISVRDLFRATADQGGRFTASSARLGPIDASLVYYRNFHDPGRAPAVSVFFGEPLNAILAVPLARLPRCADARRPAREGELFSARFERANWRVGLRACANAVELYELPPEAPGARPAVSALAKDWPDLEILREMKARLEY